MEPIELSAKLNTMAGPVHGFIYFAPEATEGYEALGLPATHHYFASRGAAFGAVPAEVIVAKHRAGPIGTKRLVFLGQYTRFDNAARAPV